MAPKKVTSGKPAAKVVPKKRLSSKQTGDDQTAAKERKLNAEAEAEAKAKEAEAKAKGKKLSQEAEEKAKAALALVPVAVQTGTVTTKAAQPDKGVKEEPTEDDEKQL